MKKRTGLSPSEITKICDEMQRVEIPMPDVIAQSLGINPKLYREDLLHNEKILKTIAKIEISLLQKWKEGNSGTERLLGILFKKYNKEYITKMTDELEHILGIVARNVDHTTLLKILDEIIEYVPDLQGKTEINIKKLGDGV